MPYPNSPASGLVRVEPGGDDDRADVGVDDLRHLAVDAHLGDVVAEAPRFRGELGVGEDEDRRPLADLRDQLVDHLTTVAIVRVHRTEACHPASELLLALDEEDAEAHVRKPDRGSEPRNAGADHHRLRRRLDRRRVERRGEAGLGNPCSDQADRLARRPGRVVAVGPRVLFANVHLGVGVWIQAGPLRDAAEGEEMQFGRARCHDQAVEVLVLDRLDDVLLGAVGAREQRRLGNHDVRLVFERLLDLRDVHDVGDVAAAVADVDADAPLAHATTSITRRVSSAAGCAGCCSR